MTVNSSKIYVGIDVSKDSLEVCIDGQKKTSIYKNTPAGIKLLIKKLKKEGETHTIVEATGGYEKLVKKLFLKEKLPISIVNPRCVRDFAKSRNILAKSDSIDAYVIREFGRTNKPIPCQPRSKEEEQLVALKNRREQLLKMLIQEKQHMELVPKGMAASIRKIIRYLEREKKLIEERIALVIKENEVFSRKEKIITSFKGVSNISASVLLCDLPELGMLSTKALSALVGLAPFCCDSGKMKGKRKIYGGRARIRKALYIRHSELCNEQFFILDFHVLTVSINQFFEASTQLAHVAFMQFQKTNQHHF